MTARLERGWQVLGYLVLALPVSIAGGLALIALGIGTLLSLVWIGIPVLAVAVPACRRAGRWHRRLANRLLDAHVPPMRSLVREARNWREALELVGDRTMWPAMALMLLAAPVGLLALAAVVAPIALTVSVAVLGVEGVLGIGDLDYIGPITFGAPAGLLLLVLTIPAAVVAVAVLDGMHGLLRVATRSALSARAAPHGAVRELLAESLGDRSVNVAYWLPESETFVDESGHRVVLPEAGSGSTWTAVERDGRRVAAIVHDAALDASPELVQAAAAGAALAIDNERLKAELRAKVEELRVSRLRIVEAADAARRELERDLHDGAQQQLVALALELRLLKARIADPEVHPFVDAVAANLSSALEELRELARGIHPAILTDRGLVPALEMVAGRGTVPVTLAVDAGDRLPPAIEAAAYFIVAEALTNVAKHAPGSAARVTIRRIDGRIEVVVEDDGPGGASPERGSGLRGLVDRIAALGGTLVVESPPGAGTRLSAQIAVGAGD